MNKDTKIIFVALIIIIIGAVSFNYMNSTGKVIKTGLTSVTISPKIVKAGQSIYINVQPGKQGVYQEIEFYKADNDLRMGGKSAQVCRSSKCFEWNTVKYKILDSWDNNERWGLNENFRDYYIRVYDIYRDKYVRSYFTVERLYEASGVTEHR